MHEQVIEGDEVELTLYMGVLREMASRKRFLGAEGGRNTKDVAEGGEAGLQVELGGLREVGILAVVVKFEEGGATCQ